MKKRIILIDARHLSKVMDGLGRYVVEVLNNLTTNPAKEEIVVLHTKEFPFNLIHKKENFTFFKINIKGSRMAQQIIVPFFIRKLKADVYYYPFIDPPLFSSAETNIFAVHDLNHFFISKEAATEKKYKIYAAKFFIFISALLYNKILVFSEYVKQHLESNIKPAQGKTEVIYHGFSPNSFADESISEDQANEVERLTPYLLYVGNNRPHKNLKRLLEAYQKIIKLRNVNLVIVGNQIPRFLDIQEYCKDLKIKDSVFTFKNVSNSYLAYIYEKAEFVVYPSVSEGFGLPLLESWHFNKPIIASKTTCIPEIGQDAVHYFDPYKVESIAENLIYLFDNQDLRVKLITKGKERLRMFNWKSSADNHLKLFLKKIENKDH